MKKNQLNIIVPKLKNFFQKEKGVLFCYIFGSFAYKNFNSKSDVDIAVYLNKQMAFDFFDKRLNLISEISRILGKEADIIILNNAPPFLRYVILKEGRLIYSREEGQRIDFELKTLNDYFDYKPILKKYYKRIFKA